jgi:hypothetical protein
VKKYIIFILIAIIFVVSVYLLFIQNNFFGSKRHAKLGEACRGANGSEYIIDCEPGLICKFFEPQKPGDRGTCVKLWEINNN